KLGQRIKAGNHRSLVLKTGLVDFTSNDYLGLAANRELHDRIVANFRGLPNGSTGSRLLSGNSNLAVDTESYLADLLNAEQMLLFDSGYMANLAIFSTLPQRGDTVIYDELSHACIKDGIRLSLASKMSFKHNDLHDLRKKLERATGTIYIALESIYSMDGDECPLADVMDLTRTFKAKIILDEAHGTGIYGKNGGGLSVSLGLEKQLFARIYTFGKAMGIHGAAVAGDLPLRDYVVNFARPFIYTTAPSPYSAVAVRSAFDYLNENIQLQEEIVRKIAFFGSEYSRLAKNNYKRTNSNHAIQSIIIPGNSRAHAAAKKLQNKGYDVRPILSPTVAEGSERLRICLHTFNSREDISGLIHSLAGL
ncbi:MAG: 8-amino-7-oxononanoate synthase, partial [Bacteroidota bacterium]